MYMVRTVQILQQLYQRNLSDIRPYCIYSYHYPPILFEILAIVRIREISERYLISSICLSQCIKNDSTCNNFPLWSYPPEHRKR